MIIITENTERTLIETLDINKPQNNDQRCVYLRTSELGPYNLEEITSFIYNNIDDQQGSIFVCEDKDIFILARGLGAPFIKLLENTLLPPTSQPAHSFKLATLSEVRVARHKILKIVEAKLKIIQTQKKKEQQEQEKNRHAKNRKAVLDQPIAATLIETLTQRRKERETNEILVVEDDPFSRKLILNAFPDTYNVSLAEDGQNAIAQYFIKAPDVLFLDIGLPDIDGHDVLEKVLKHDPQAFIIMLSGKGDKENIMKAIQNGAKGFVGKPFTRDKLFQYIEKSPHII